MKERIQKFLSRAGVASRRAAEILISSGRVKVNGRVASELGTKIDPAKDKVEVNGRVVKPVDELIYLVLNKPKGVVTTRRDKYGRPTVYDLLPKDVRAKVWSVGRLDLESEGLLIFTNDGELTQELSHPSFEHKKTYEVALNKKIAPDDEAVLEEGVTLAGQKTAPAKVKIINAKTMQITIHEGRKRQIRRMLAALGFEVLRLVRMKEAGLDLKKLNLKPGEVKAVAKDDIL